MCKKVNITMKNIIKKKPVIAAEEESTEDISDLTAKAIGAGAVKPQDVFGIEGFNPMFAGWNTDQIQLVFGLLTGEEDSDVDEDAQTEIIDIFTTELELRTNLKEWRLYRKAFPEGERFLLQELRLDSAKPYYLTQRIFRGKQKALVALRNVRETGELE
jgi:hypothetical protein